MKRITLVLGVASLLAAVAPGVARAIDLTVENVEVTQATQTPANTIRLVAQRSTAVRATVRTGGFLELRGVTGRLHVFVDGVEITPAAGISAINEPFTAPPHRGALAPRRNDENDTLNFELPAPTGITASSDVDFRVDLAPFPGETDPANNSGSADDLVAVRRSVPLLYFTRIDYTPSGLGLPDLALVQPGTGDAFVRGILPVDDSSSFRYRETPSTMTYDEDADRDGRLNGADASDLLNRLEISRQLLVRNGAGATDRVFLYGWIAGNPIDGNGLAKTGGRVAFGNTDQVRHQRSYAHELTHNFGLSHNNAGLDEVGWDVGARLVDNPAGNNEANRVKPVTTPVTGPDFEIQNPARLTNEAWIGTANYTFLLDHPSLQEAPCLWVCRGERVAVIRGVVAGEKLRVKQVFRFPWSSEPSDADSKGDFVAEVTDTEGVTTSRRFDALVSDDLHREGNGAFSVMVPVHPAREIASLRITDADGKELASLKRSQPPRFSISSPRPGAALGDRTEVGWTVSDADTPSGQLAFQAAYSPDGGSSWSPIGVDIPGTARSLSFDSSQVEKSEGKGMIRVFVSDGLNTVFADVVDLKR